MTDQELDRLLYAHAGAARDLVLAQLPPEGELPDIPTSPWFLLRAKPLSRPVRPPIPVRSDRQPAYLLRI